MSVKEKFNQNLNHLLPKPLPSRIALAVSGGADSIFMAYLTQQWAKKHNVSLICLIVDHRLRPESKQEAIQTLKFLNSNGLEAEILIWKSLKPKKNIQAKAREARYKLMLQYCRKNNITHLFTAHNMEDQAETILMRALHGSGITGLAGIPEINNIGKISVIRPILIFTRQEITLTLEKINWPFVVDPSNVDEKYERTKIRSFLSQLPEQYLTIQKLVTVGKKAHRVNDYLNKEVFRIFSAICQITSCDAIKLDISAFKELHEEIALRLLVHIFNYVRGGEHNIRSENLEALYVDLLKQQNVTKTFAHCEIIKLTANTLIILKEYVSIAPAAIIKPNEELTWDNRYCIINNSGISLVVRRLEKDGLKILKSSNKKPTKAKMMYPSISIWDQDGNLIYHPATNFPPKNKNLVSIQRI